MRKGLDTNVIIYALDNSDEEKHRKAVRIIEDLFENPSNYAVAVQTLTEAVYVVKRKYPPALETLLQLIDLISSTPGIKTIQYGAEDVINASRHKNFWDALLAYTYLRAGISTIITENTKDYSNLPVRAENPFMQ